jgi:hypothetical protein
MKDIESIIVEVAKKQRNQIEEMLKQLPTGMILCVHEDLILMQEQRFLEMDYKYSIVFETHVFSEFQNCSAQVRKTQYNKNSQK